MPRRRSLSVGDESRMTYRAGLIGTSFVAEGHATAYERVDGIELAAVADIDADALAAFADDHSVPAAHAYESHEAMLDAEDLDVLSVATPSYLHRDHVIDATESAADPEVVWCEKPIGLSVAEGEEMIEACDRSDTELLVNHQRRFGDEYRALRTLVGERDILGDIEAVHVHAPRELLRNGTHFVDLLYLLLDSPATRVSGYLTAERGSVEGGGSRYDDAGGGGTILTGDGTFVTFDGTTERSIAVPRMEFVGTGGLLDIRMGDEWRYWTLEEGDGSYGTSHVETTLPPETTPTTNEEKLANGARHVVELIEGNAENLSPGEDAAHALEIIVSMFVSHYTGSRVSLPLDPPLRDVRIVSG